MDKVRAHVKVEGRVQGVCFRSYTKKVAEDNNVTGWVGNMPDGSVEMVLEGEKKDVKKVIDWAYEGPSYAKVTNVVVNWEGYRGEFNGFKVRYW